MAKKSLNFKTANKYLLNAVDNAPDDKKLKVLKDKIKIYRTRMTTNSDNFFKKGTRQADDFLYTLDTIEKRIATHIKGGKFSKKKLQQQLNRLVKNSRKFQKQTIVVDSNIGMIKESPSNAKFDYILTHPIKTTHSDECLRDFRNSPFTKKEALAVMARKPNHLHCDCTVVRRKTTVKQLRRR